MIFDPLTITSLSLYAALAAVTLLSLPARDREPGQMKALLCIIAGTLVAYSSASLPLFAAGWTLTVVPYWTWLKTGPKFALAAGTLALVAGAAMYGNSGSTAHLTAFGLLIAAAMLRKGIFPFHSWVANGMDQSPVLPLGLLLNGHLGVFLIIRFAIPLLPHVEWPALTLLSALTLFTALYTAVLALAEKRPRRVLGYLSVSQASFLLAGLESRNTEGITGALVHSAVVAMATTGLYCVYRALEARYPAVAIPTGYLGLVNHAPRLAAFFALCGLSLIGLPGTLGFAAEDLLFHGSLESHPLLGIMLPLATALNGITIYRLFSTLFLGRAATATPVIADALPRERWALSAVAVFLVVNGIVPSFIVSLRTPAGEQIAALLGVR
jgi:NADH-quinone oxidoreductase subunit M